LNSNYLNADETTIKVLDKNKKGTTHQGYYWVYCILMTNPMLVCYAPDKKFD